MFGNIKIDIVSDKPKLSGVINNLTPRGMVEIVDTVLEFLDIPSIEAYKTLKGIYEPTADLARATPPAEKPAAPPSNENISKLTTNDIATLVGAELKVLSYLTEKADEDGIVIYNRQPLVNKFGYAPNTISATVSSLEDKGIIKRVVNNRKECIVKILKRM